jgi:hypothetical protein
VIPNNFEIDECNTLSHAMHKVHRSQSIKGSHPLDWHENPQYCEDYLNNHISSPLRRNSRDGNQ